MDEQAVKMLNPLKLAFLGDAIYEAYIRTYLVNEVVLTPHEMSKRAVKYVKASAQASLVNGIRALLTEEEWIIVKRGRNQKSSTVPKNALLIDYKYATGFEALIGYLHLTQNESRIIEIIKAGIRYLETEAKSETGAHGRGGNFE
ncbi:MAG TPA: Mini-ribonuclease 3 [Clostridiales bacterium UBA8960]|nr:Mini-ribonuclease 3 [Clostridiales bacterium UBA8960]